MSEDPVMLKAREWRGIRFAEESISEVRDGRRVASAARQQVQRIILCHGRQRTYWLLELIGGLVITLGSLVPLRQFLLWMIRGEAISSATFFLLIFVLIGVAVMIDALRTGYYLDIHVSLAGSRLRLRISGTPTVEEIDQFLRSVEGRFDYSIERSVASSGFPLNSPDEAPKNQ